MNGEGIGGVGILKLDSRSMAKGVALGLVSRAAMMDSRSRDKKRRCDVRDQIRIDAGVARRKHHDGLDDHLSGAAHIGPYALRTTLTAMSWSKPVPSRAV